MSRFDLRLATMPQVQQTVRRVLALAVSALAACAALPVACAPNPSTTARSDQAASVTSTVASPDNAASQREPAPGDSALTEPATPDIEITLTVQGTQRRAILVNAAIANAKRPTVIVLHGALDNADHMREMTGFDAVARANAFAVVYAEGTDLGDGRHAWNTGHLLRDELQGVDDIAYLDALIDTLIRDHAADPTRIYLTGVSNGGMLTFVYGAARAPRLAAIAPVVASMFTFETVPKAPLPTLIINAAEDDQIPLDGGMSPNPRIRAAQATAFKPVSEVVDFWVKANKSAAKAVTTEAATIRTTTYPARKNGAVTEFVLDTDGGHGWPGSPWHSHANAAIDFNGAERVWDFFKDKSRPSAAPSSGATPRTRGSQR